MKISPILYVILTLPLCLKAWALDPDVATGSYSVEEKGFNLKHFDRMLDSQIRCEKFNGRILRGGQPDLNSDLWLDKLKANSVSLVVDLRKDASHETEKNKVARAGMDYVYLPLSTMSQNQDRNITVEETGACQSSNCAPHTDSTTFYRTKATIHVLALIRDALDEGRNIYIHCTRGQDRTGTIVALLRHCRQEDWDPEFKNYKGFLYPALKSHLKEVQEDEDYPALFN